MRQIPFALILLLSAQNAMGVVVTNNNDSGAGSLRDAIFTVNSNAGESSITFASNATITLLSSLPPIKPLNPSLTITGPQTIDGGGSFRPFSVDSGTIAIQNISVTNGKAQGGAGVSSGGGGAGFGGGLFIRSGDVTLSNVSFDTCRAAGGVGGAGAVFTARAGGGGGGMGGAGGSPNSSSGGGGGGFQCPGVQNGGGLEDSSGICTGTEGGTAGAVGSAGASMAGSCTGGGPGGMGNTGSDYGGGGGGGIGGAGGNRTVGNPGCNGGNGNVGGSGGFGAGGGGGGGGGAAGSGQLTNGTPGSPNAGGAGLFGGGGGGGGPGLFGSTSGAAAGAGGFGGGGGGGGIVNGSGQAGGSFAGNGANGSGGGLGQTGGGGGGGAALGGAVFVNTNATLTIQTSSAAPFANGAAPVPGSGGVGNPNSGSAGSLGSGSGGIDLFMLAGSNLNFNITGTTTLSNPIDGGTDTGSGGAVTLQGGNLIIQGANTYLGNTTVQGGTLAINGSVASPTTEVMNGGTLKGNGTFNAVTVDNGGTIAAGNSIGNMNIASLTLNSGSILQVEINPTISSTYTISGNADLGNATVFIVQDGVAGDYPASMSYTFLTAGSLSNSFNPTVSGGLPGFAFQLMQRTNSVVLFYGATPVFIIPIPTGNLSGNTLNFANYLNNHALNSSATQALAALSGATLKNALNSASPARNAFMTYVTQNTLFGLSELLTNHLWDQRYYHGQRANRPNVAALFAEMSDTLTADSSERIQFRNPCCDKYSFWVGGMGEYSHQKSQDQNPAFHFISGSALLGFDYYGTENNLFGFSGGYAYTHLVENHNAGHAKINYYFANIYDTYYSQKGYLELALWGVYNQIHNYRHISFPGFDATASATIDSWQLTPHLGFGYDAQYCWGVVEPYAQADCAINWQPSFHEHGAGAFDMTQTSRTSEFLRAEAGFRLYESRETSWGAWMIMEKLSYVYKKAFGSGQVSAAIVGTSALFSVESFRGSQNLGSAGIEFLWRFGCCKPVTLSLAYNGEMGSKYMSHEGLVQLMKDF